MSGGRAPGKITLLESGATLRRPVPALLTLAALLAGCSGVGQIKAGSGTGRTLGSPPDGHRLGDDDDDATTPEAPPGRVAGLTIAAVTANQGSQLVLLDDEGATSSPLVAGRPTLVRVHVTPEAVWEARPVRAVLTWQGENVRVLDQTLTPVGPSVDLDLDSTFTFELPPEEVVPGAAWSVELLEVDGGAGPGDDTGAAWPGDDTLQPVLVERTGTLKVHVLPIAYGADGSDRLPDTSPEQILLLEDLLLRTWPVEAVELTVDPTPYPLDYPVWPNGANWGDLLYDITGERVVRSVPDDTYLFALFRPTATPSAYCAGGCFTGRSWTADDPDDAFARVSVGLGYPGEGTALTMLHQLGHTHGRSDAPCSGINPDPEYPYEDATLGAPGWDHVDGDLKDPAEHRDLMSWCAPRWASDYTWLALHQRAVRVNVEDAAARLPDPWRVLGIEVDGTLELAGLIHPADAPDGDEVKVELLDADGKVLASVLGRFQPDAHMPGGALLLPEPEDKQVAGFRALGQVVWR